MKKLITFSLILVGLFAVTQLSFIKRVNPESEESSKQEPSSLPLKKTFYDTLTQVPTPNAKPVMQKPKVDIPSSQDEVSQLKTELYNLEEDKDFEKIEALIEDLLNLDPENQFALRKLASIQVNAKLDYENGMYTLEGMLENSISQGDLVQLYFEAARFGGKEDRAISFLNGFLDHSDQSELFLVNHYLEKLEKSKSNNDN